MQLEVEKLLGLDGKKEIELTPNDIYDEMHDTDDFEYFREQTEVVDEKPKEKIDWKIKNYLLLNFVF